MSLILVLTVVMAPMGVAKADSTTPTIYADQPTIDGTGKVGEEFTVNIFVDTAGETIWGWQVAINFNNTLLSCTARGGATPPSGSWMGFLGGTINNALGYVGPSSNTLNAFPEVSGNFALMWFNFTVLAEGISDVHIEDALLYKNANPPVYATPANVIDVYTVIAEEQEFVVEILHNVTFVSVFRTGLSGHAFSLSGKELSFAAKGGSTQLAFCNVTIPGSTTTSGLMWCSATTEWIVDVGGSPVTPVVTENATHTFIHFTYTTSTTGVDIKIISTNVVPEFPATLIVTLLLIATLAAAILGKMVWARKRRERFIV
jgi:hypothetical protein